MTRVVITGVGIVSAAGRGLDATEAALREGRDGLRALTRFRSPRCGHFPVAECDAREGDGPWATALARPALRDALAGAGWTGATDDVGLALGCTVGGMPETEAAVGDLLAGGVEPTPSVWGGHECGAVTAALAAEAGLGAPP